MFVGVVDATGIHPFHAPEIDQRTNHRFYRFAAHFGHSGGIALVFGELLVHTLVMLFVDAVIYLLKLGGFAAAFPAQRAVFAISLAAPVSEFTVALAVGLFAFEKQFGLVAS